MRYWKDTSSRGHFSASSGILRQGAFAERAEVVACEFECVILKKNDGALGEHALPLAKQGTRALAKMRDFA